MSIEGLVFERGARFSVGEPHPTASAEAFSANAVRNPQLKRMLQGSRWRLLQVQNFDEMDPDGDRDYTRETEAVYYDYTRNRTVRVRGAAGGRGKLDIQVSTEQPIPSPQEFAAAVELVRKSPVWGPMLAAEQIRTYKPMPPVREPDEGEVLDRTLFVGLISKPRKFNRIVAVNMVTGEVSAEAIRPWHAKAAEQICGVQENFCFPPARGTSGAATIKWPAQHPVWQFQVVRPAASLGCNGSGIELRNVRFRGRNVLKHAHVPILNVQYPTSEFCGPYRDWLYEETCFEAVGEDIPGAPGIRWCSEPAKTIWDTGVDGGDFNGVAIYEDPNDGALVLITVCAAGWYRYLPEWRFYPDGRIQPRFKFGAVDNSCVCETHNHHAYWRLHFNILNRFNALDEKVKDQWVIQRRETGFFRNEGEQRIWRVRNYRKKLGYEIIPGEHDGIGDDYSGDDQFALLYNRNQIDDGHCSVVFNTEANIAQYINNAPLVNREIVVWYAAHFHHDVTEEGDAHAIAIGPTLQPYNWPAR